MKHPVLITIFILVLTFLCSSQDTQAQEPRLDITLLRVRGTTIKAIVKNASKQGIYLLRSNLLDPQSKRTKKVSVYRNGTLVPFAGINFNYDMDAITCDDFTHLPPESSLSDEFDIATTTDLSTGGSIKIRSHGIVPYSTESCNATTGILRYKSNDLTFTVDGKAASAIYNDDTDNIIRTSLTNPLSKRTQVQNDCSSPQYYFQTLRALHHASEQATMAAAIAASTCDARFHEYFKTCSPAVRQKVVKNLHLAAAEASSINSGSTTYFCTDRFGHCRAKPERKILAYYQRKTRSICLCERYWEKDGVSRVCHYKDRWGITLHEMLHGVDEGVVDIDGAYGYEEVVKLSAYEAIRNADNYALYVNAVYLDCPVNETNFL